MKRAYNKTTPLPDTYRGYKRLRQERNRSGYGTHAVCEVHCGRCGKPIERNAMAIQMKEKSGGDFLCSKKCQGEGTETT